MSVKENLSHMKGKIKEACRKVDRQPENIQIIAVTKYVSNKRAKEVIDAGVVHLGENRDDTFLKKWNDLKEDKPIWHFIGTLQSRKVRNVINKIDYLHSLDRMSLAKEIEKRAKNKVKCFVQVNVTNEQSKFGLDPSEVKQFILKLADFQKIEVIGLMTMAPLTDDEIVLRKCFRELRKLQQEIAELQLEYAPCQQLSMGMSNDFQIAIEEGATMIRVGTALVGEDN